MQGWLGYTIIDQDERVLKDVVTRLVTKQIVSESTQGVNLLGLVLKKLLKADISVHERNDRSDHTHSLFR